MTSPDTTSDHAASNRPGTGAASRLTRRRARTRQRLLDAALPVFAEQGFGRCTVEQVCDRAGFSRGAFYSNFDSLEQLFLTMWEQRSERMLTHIREAVRNRPHTSAPERPQSLTTATERLLAAVPMDDAWYRINAEFTAHALRHQHLKPELAAREAAILDTIMPLVETELARCGRRLTAAPDTVGRALVAVHDGTSTQCLVEPDNAAAHQLRRDLFVRLLESYTEASDAPAGEAPDEQDAAEADPEAARSEEAT